MAEGGDLDFDPLGEGKIDINDFNDDDLAPLLPQQQETQESWRSRFSKYITKRNVHINDSELDSFSKGEDESAHDWGNRIRKNVVEEIQMERLDKIGEAENRIRSKYPNWNPRGSNFSFTMDEYGRVIVELRNKGAKKYSLLDEYDKLPNTIKADLGKSRDDIEERDAIKNQLDGLFPENKINNEFDFRYNGGVIEITHDGLRNWHSLYNKNVEINRSLPKTVRSALGDEANVIQDRNEAINNKRSEQISALETTRAVIEDDDTPSVIKEKEERNVMVNEQIQGLEQEIAQLEERNEEMKK
jgi:hypothetical protein